MNFKRQRESRNLEGFYQIKNCEVVIEIIVAKLSDNVDENVK